MTKEQIITDVRENPYSYMAYVDAEQVDIFCEKIRQMNDTQFVSYLNSIHERNPVCDYFGSLLLQTDTLLNQALKLAEGEKLRYLIAQAKVNVIELIHTVEPRNA